MSASPRCHSISCLAPWTAIFCNRPVSTSNRFAWSEHITGWWWWSRLTLHLCTPYRFSPKPYSFNSANLIFKRSKRPTDRQRLVVPEREAAVVVVPVQPPLLVVSEIRRHPPPADLAFWNWPSHPNSGSRPWNRKSECPPPTFRDWEYLSCLINLLMNCFVKKKI